MAVFVVALKTQHIIFYNVWQAHIFMTEIKYTWKTDVKKSAGRGL